MRKASFLVAALAVAGDPALGQTLGGIATNISNTIYSLVVIAFVVLVVGAVVWVLSR